MQGLVATDQTDMGERREGIQVEAPTGPFRQTGLPEREKNRHGPGLPMGGQGPGDDHFGAAGGGGREGGGQRRCSAPGEVRKGHEVGFGLPSERIFPLFL